MFAAEIEPMKDRRLTNSGTMIISAMLMTAEVGNQLTINTTIISIKTPEDYREGSRDTGANGLNSKKSF